MDDNGKVAHINLSQLRECRVQLRPVDKRTVEYRELRDSIKAHGLWQGILVRPAEDGMYEVVDGFYRYNCCKELRHKDIPCLIRELTDTEVMIVQIQTNAVRLETDPIDYARHLWRIIKEDKEMTVGQVAYVVKKSPGWVRKMLKITRLCPEASTAVRRGQLSITIAHELAKIPPKTQRELLAQALVIPATEFLPIIRTRVRQFKEAIKNGSMAAYYRSYIEPVAHLRKMTELTAELKSPAEGANLLLRMGLESPMDGWNLCLRWVLHLDPDAVEKQKSRLAYRHMKDAEQAELRKQDREILRTGELKNE
jgi:ParB/RepB/Spo0J family partition protein